MRLFAFMTFESAMPGAEPYYDASQKEDSRLQLAADTNCEALSLQCMTMEGLDAFDIVVRMLAFGDD